MFGFISLQTATELISLALVFNKVTGVYGLLAILTGYQLSLFQLSTYLYSIAVLVALILLVPHIRRQSPFECLALAWLYIADTIINTFDTVIFGLQWYFTSGATEGSETIPKMVTEGIQSLREQSAMHGNVVSHETAASMAFIVALSLIRVYFGVVVMAYAQQVLHKHMQVLVVEGPGLDEHDGPFAQELPDGEGRKGKLGRLMVSYGRGYWLDQWQGDEWARDLYGKNGTRV